LSTIDETDILTPKARKERNRQEMIDTILAVAQKIMREEGVGALNLQVLARRVGMRAPSLYNYFPNKMAIYEALFERGMRRYREELAQNLADHDVAREGQTVAIQHYMNFALENPELFQLLFERPIPGFVPSEAGLEEGRRLIELGHQATERLRAGDQIHASIATERARDLFVALTHGLTAQHLANEPHLPVGEGRFGSLIPLAVRALELLYRHGLDDD
jgi:AcrR family transcriptional regulator